jgi:hypothetical protein
VGRLVGRAYRRSDVGGLAERHGFEVRREASSCAPLTLSPTGPDRRVQWRQNQESAPCPEVRRGSQDEGVRLAERLPPQSSEPQISCLYD